MAIRVTQAEVEELLPTDIADITVFITAASMTIDDLLLNKGLTATQLKEIERWLSAHFLAMREEGGGIERHKIGDTEADYAGLGKNLRMTRFGVTALSLDTTGILAKLGGKVAKLTVVSTI